MKRYIFDEVATFEEATRDLFFTQLASLDLRYCHDRFGTLETRLKENGSQCTWLKLTVLEGAPEAIAEAMILMGNQALIDWDQPDEREPIDCEPDTLANLELSEGDFR